MLTALVTFKGTDKVWNFQTSKKGKNPFNFNKGQKEGKCNVNTKREAMEPNRLFIRINVNGLNKHNQKTSTDR